MPSLNVIVMMSLPILNIGLSMTQCNNDQVLELGCPTHMDNMKGECQQLELNIPLNNKTVSW